MRKLGFDSHNVSMLPESKLLLTTIGDELAAWLFLAGLQSIPENATAIIMKKNARDSILSNLSVIQKRFLIYFGY